MELQSQPEDWLSCYNTLGEFTFSDDLNDSVPYWDIFSIGPANTNQINTYDLDVNDIVVVFNQGGLYADSADVTWPGGYMQINGTTNFDGIYYVEQILASGIYVLAGESTDDVEFTGQVRTHYKNLRLYAEITIENDEEIIVRTDVSGDGLFRVGVHDYLKDYFKYQLSPPQQGSFNQYFCTLRYSLSYRDEYDKVDRVWNAEESQYEYIKTRTLGGLSVPIFKKVVNSALKYKDALAAGLGVTLESYLVDTSSTNVPFLTYRPTTSYVTVDQDVYITHLRDSVVSDTYTGTIISYNAQGTALSSTAVSAAAVVYNGPHHLIWNVGATVNSLPAATSYYTFHVLVNGTQRTEQRTFKIVEKCNKWRIEWKNEFGAIDDFVFSGVTESAATSEFDTFGTSPVISTTNPGNAARRNSVGGDVLVLNSGLVNTDHAHWLLGLVRSTEVFAEDLESSVAKKYRKFPIIVNAQTVGQIRTNNRTHNITFEAQVPFNVAHRSNLTQ